MPATAQVFTDPTTQKFRRPTEIKLTEEAPKRTFGTASLKDMFPQMSVATHQPQALALTGMNLDGLGVKSSKMLGNNHFVVVQGTAFDTMSAIYKSNRETDKSNFITADPFVHAYFAFNNATAYKVVSDTLYPELRALLPALMESCVKDYRLCEIDEVKDDIQRNLAFIIVALKLLDPKIVLPDMGGASDLARSEMEIISRGKKERSVIFNREEDFSSLRPMGLYLRSEKTANYFRSVAWLSRMYLTLSDVTNNSETGGGNKFRRALLLYRALELGRNNRSGKAAAAAGDSLMPAWQRIYEISLSINPSSLTREQTVYPRELKSMFQAGNLEFRDMLQTLAQPFSRARLLLSIKKQKPQGLDAASIFEMEKNRGAEENLLVMRFLPPVNSYELDWLKTQTATYREEGEEGFVSPLALFILYAWGSPVASNILHNLSDRMDPSLINTLPELVRVAGKRRVEADPNAPNCVAEKRWAIITEYFRPFKKNSLSCLLSELWYCQHVLSASAAFADSYTAFDAPAPAAATNAVTGTAQVVESKLESMSESKAESKPEISAAARMFGAVRPVVRRASNFHYLEPMPDLYRKLGALMSITENDLTRLKCFPEERRKRTADYIRLLDRLAKIADQELAVQPISEVDFKLLANIDQILAAIGSPVAGSIYVPGIGAGAASMGPGDAGAVNAIFSTTQGAYLSRGAVYTYYEIAGGPFKQAHWERKKEFGFLRPPGWIAAADIISDAVKSSTNNKSNANNSNAIKTNATKSGVSQFDAGETTRTSKFKTD